MDYRALMLEHLRRLLAEKNPAWLNYAALYHGVPCWRR